MAIPIPAPVSCHLTEGGTTTANYYSNQWQLIETRQGGTVTTQDVWGMDYVNDLVLRDDSSSTGNLGISGSGLGERLYAQHDANYDTTALTNTSGGVVERFVYGTYGGVMVLTAAGSVTTDGYHFGTLYQGGMIDTVTGLYEFQRRDYSPMQGRWTEADLKAYVSGMNRYQLELSNPVSYLDPAGLAPILASGG
jgi:RHS repeat-associated protein